MENFALVIHRTYNEMKFKPDYKKKNPGILNGVH